MSRFATLKPTQCALWLRPVVPPEQRNVAYRAFNRIYGAAERGYVRLPNVDTLVEMMDMREATRAYEANLNMIESARTMTSRALDLLRR